MCGKSSTKTSTTAPTDPNVTAAYDSLLAKGQTLASQPLQTYSGQLVAPLNSLQNQAISTIQNSGSLAQPYLTEAADYAQKGATPITNQDYSADAINQYLSPYLGDVVQSTQAAQNLQNAQQQQSLQGNITAAGAWGGDRSAVLQSQLAGQQKTADNATIANLYNTGFTQAQNQFNTTNQLGLQTQQANNANAQNTAYSLGNLGTALQNSALSGANAELNAGTLQQQVAQENLNVPYEQYLQQQAFPYQNLSFLAGLMPGIQQGTGTTSTQTTPGANPFSQILGLGTTVAGLLKDGGRARRADGGGGLQDSSPSMLDLLESSQMARDSGGAGAGFAPPPVMNYGQSYVPTVSPTGGGGGMQAANFGPDAQQQPNELSGAADFGKSVYDAFDRNSNANSLDSMDDQVAELTGDPGGASSGGGGIGSFFSNLFSHDGGRVAKGGRTRLADGGEDDYSDDMDPTDPRMLLPAGASAMSLQDTPPDWQKLTTNYAQSEDDSAPQGSFTSDMGVPAGGASLSGPQPTWDDGTPVAAPPPAAGSDGWGMQHAAQIMPQIYKAKPDWHRALTTAGAAMMAGTSPFFGENVGKGVQAGVNEYYDQEDKDNHPQVDHSGPTSLIRYADGTVVDTGLPTEAAITAKATNDYRRTNMDTIDAQRRDAVAQRAATAQAGIDERAAAAKQAELDRQTQLKIAQQNADSGRWTFAGTDPATKKPIFLDSKTGKTQLGDTQIGAKPGTASFRSLPAMIANKYMSDHPDATAEDAENFAARFGEQQKAMRDFGTGQQGNAVRSFNVALTHLDTLRGLGEALQNGDVQGINKFKNSFAAQFGQPAPTNFNAAKSFVADEVTKGVLGSAGALADREKANDNLSNASSWPQLIGAINTYQNLGAGQIHGLKQQYEDSTGQKDFMNKLSPESQGVYSRYYPAAKPGDGGNPGSAKPVTAAPTVTTKSQFDALDHNTVYTGNDGKQYRKP